MKELMDDVDQIEQDVTAAIRAATERYTLDTGGNTVDLHAGAAPRGAVVQESGIASMIRARRVAWLAEELAELLCLSVQHIYKLAKTGRMPSHRVGGSVRFDPATTADWWESKVTG
jgi:excisionase family DNA binding protein